MKQITQYQAFDGETFATEAECRTHEAGLSHMRLVGLTAEQVEAAIARTDPDLAKAIEDVGAKIARVRRESGELRRTRKSSEPPMAPGSEG